MFVQNYELVTTTESKIHTTKEVRDSAKTNSRISLSHNDMMLNVDDNQQITHTHTHHTHTSSNPISRMT